jgi:hypothetical protein
MNAKEQSETQNETEIIRRVLKDLATLKSLGFKVEMGGIFTRSEVAKTYTLTLPVMEEAEARLDKVVDLSIRSISGID